MIRRRPRSTRSYTLVPYATLVRSRERDRAADGDDRGARVERAARGDDSLLIACRAVGGADAGHDEEPLGPQPARVGDLGTRANDAVDARCHREFGEVQHLLAWCAIDADRLEIAEIGRASCRERVLQYV